jgi:hypothetical protein
MRINELNMFQNLLKGVTDTVGKTARAVKGSMSGSEDDMAKKMFINKFVSRAGEALNTAVQQKLVNPNITKLSGAGSASTPTTSAPAGQATPTTSAPAGQATPSAPATGGTTAPAASSTTSPAASTAGGTPPVTATQPGGKAPGNVAVPTGGKQGQAKPQVDVNVDKIISGMRKLQPSGTKPVPPESKIAKEIIADMPNVSLNKDYLLRVGDKILKLDHARYDVKDLHRQFMGQYAKGSKQQTIQESIEESRLEELYNRLTSTEKFRNALKKTGYDPELAISRIGALLAKRRKMASQRDELIDLDEVSPQGGGKVAGQLSNSPNAIRKRNARLAARTAAQQQAAPQQQTAPAPQAAPQQQQKVAPQQQTTAPKQAAPQQQQKVAPQQQTTAPKQAAPQQQTTQQQATQQAAPAAAPTAAKPGRPSMGQWLKDNFIKNFFRGVPWQSAEPQIDKILMRLPKSYKDGTIQKDLQDIASIGWSLSPKKD